MSRTTAAAVKLVLLRDYDDDPEVGDPPSLTPFIDAASAMVDDLVAWATDNNIAVPADARLELTERWLAAHCYQQSDQGYSSKSTAGASASFQGQTGKGLDSTKYGQTAISLDRTGYLRKLSQEAAGSGRKIATAAWLGKPPSAQTDYEDRD